MHYYSLEASFSYSIFSPSMSAGQYCMRMTATGERRFPISYAPGLRRTNMSPLPCRHYAMPFYDFLAYRPCHAMLMISFEVR